MVYVRFLGCGGSERVVQRRNSPYLEIHSSESALHKSKNSLALDDLRVSKKWHHGTELYTDVVYHFIYWHWKTCWFTIWENSNQIKNSGPVFFGPESRLQLIQISSGMYQKKGAKAWNSGIIDGFEEMEYEFSFGTFRLELEIMTIHFQIFCFSWRFSAGTDPKVVFRLLPNQIFGKRFVNSKQPVLSFSGWDLYVVNF